MSRLNPSAQSAYVDDEDVRSIFPRGTMLELFGEDGDREIAASNRALVRCIRSAHAELTSNLEPEFDAQIAELPNKFALSELLKLAELEYVRYFAYQRRPGLAAKIGESYLKDLEAAARKRVDRVKDALQRIPKNDNPPEKPANVGCITVSDPQRVVINGTDGSRNSGDF